MRIVPDTAWLVSDEMERLAKMLRDGSPRVDYRQRFLELAEQMAAFQVGETLASVVRRYGTWA